MANILILSKDSLLSKVLDYALTCSGHMVHVVQNPKLAFRLIQRPQFQFLLSDFNLLYSAIFLPSITVIAMGEGHEEAQMISHMSGEIDDYVLRPFEVQEITKMVKKHYERRSRLALFDLGIQSDNIPLQN